MPLQFFLQLAPAEPDREDGWHLVAKDRAVGEALRAGDEHATRTRPGTAVGMAALRPRLQRAAARRDDDRVVEWRPGHDCVRPWHDAGHGRHGRQRVETGSVHEPQAGGRGPTDHPDGNRNDCNADHEVVGFRGFDASRHAQSGIEV